MEKDKSNEKKDEESKLKIGKHSYHEAQSLTMHYGR